MLLNDKYLFTLVDFEEILPILLRLEEIYCTIVLIFLVLIMNHSDKYTVKNIFFNVNLNNFLLSF